jgi:hypothetical protein
MKDYLKLMLPTALGILMLCMTIRIYAGQLPPPVVRDAGKVIQTLPPKMAKDSAKADVIRAKADKDLAPLKADYAAKAKKVQDAYAILKANCYHYEGKNLVHGDCSFR